MLDLVNALTCGMLMLLLYPVAIVMNHAGHWPQRLALIFASVVMGLQAVAPVFEWLPSANSLQVVFNVVMAFGILVSRREIMMLVRLTVGAPPDERSACHPKRRMSDLSEEMMGRANGGKRDAT